MKSRYTDARSALAPSRRWADRVVTVAVTTGATLVLLAIASIFLFLIWASWPLFWADTRSEINTYNLDTHSPVVVALSETEYLAQDTASGDFKVFALGNPSEQKYQDTLGNVFRLAVDEQSASVLVTVTTDGVLRLYSDYDWFVGDSSAQEVQQPMVSRQLAELPEALRVQAQNNDAFNILLYYEDRVEWLVARSERGPVSQSTQVSLQQQLSLDAGHEPSRVHFIGQGGMLLSVAKDGRYWIYQSDSGVSAGRFSDVTELTFVRVLRSSYGIALIDSNTLVHIYGLSFDDQGPVLSLLDQYPLTDAEPTEAFAPPFGGLIVASSSGNLEWLDTDFQRQQYLSLPQPPLSHEGQPAWYMTPHGVIVRATGDEFMSLKVDTRERSLRILSLFERRTYEGYEDPQYIWQSMPLTPTAESKFSITPLILGTVKAAFYSLLFAAPLAIAAAIFTSYFLTADLRARIKPLVELLAAIPTVILGLVAGLWLAPWLEQHLGLMISFVMAVPFCLYLASIIWRLLPGNRTEARLSSFELLFSAAAIAFALLIASALSELAASGTSHTLVSYLAHEWDIEYEQRNAIVVGLVMGFAVIPTIYSIAEDALAAVPPHLREGALAMGASEWQAAKSVVLPTAAPGILSAVMMGFARAVGETMIVLMATGNTATMDPSLFTGLRTLSATLALEMPEVVPDSVHFHVLMFIALLLFLFTFVLNSVAEWVRTRLRERVAQL